MSSRTLAVVDSGGGNLGSLLAALERRGVTPILTEDPAVVDAADAAILPGDGAFAATMRALEERGLDGAIRRLVARGRPFLGICVGMQLLFEASEEHEDYAGLGILPGTIRRFEHAPRVPHMGWNDLEIVAAHPFVANVATGDFVYFLHSYRAEVGPHTLAAATHGERFAAIVAQGNVMGTQFHPEKSQTTGARLLDNFLALRVA
jgi:glutamine amidotransferase